MLMLNAIRHFVTVRITLFIASTPLEAQLSTCSDIAYHDKMKTPTANVRWYNAKHREGCACFQEKYSKVCITRADVRTPTLSTCRLQVQQFLLPFGL